MLPKDRECSINPRYRVQEVGTILSSIHHCCPHWSTDKASTPISKFCLEVEQVAHWTVKVIDYLVIKRPSIDQIFS